MTKLFIANIRTTDGWKPLVTVRAAAEGEAQEASFVTGEVYGATGGNGTA